MLIVAYILEHLKQVVFMINDSNYQGQYHFKGFENRNDE